LLDSYRFAFESWNGVDENNLRNLPEPNLSSSDSLAHSLGLIEKFAEEFALAMDDDFNTRQAISKTMSIVREVNRLLNSDLDSHDLQSVGFYALELFEQQAGNVLGLLPERENINVEAESIDPKKQEISGLVETLLSQRTQARTDKDWVEADRIRDVLLDMGVTVKDTPDGPVWDLS
ncbi:MAG: hypothetical protein CMB64_02495, partial [Euryarchaeota archaeon]|nr:hypothetical protein [Euryarchaeota archaeon]